MFSQRVQGINHSGTDITYLIKDSVYGDRREVQDCRRIAMNLLV